MIRMSPHTYVYILNLLYYLRLFTHMHVSSVSTQGFKGSWQSTYDSSCRSLESTYLSETFNSKIQALFSWPLKNLKIFGDVRG